MKALTSALADDLIDRARRGEASPEEIERLEAWRRSSADNEHHYQWTLRLLEAGRGLGDDAVAVPRPTADEIIARSAARRRFTGRGMLTRWAPWVIAAAASITAVVVLRSGAGRDGGIPGWGTTEVVTGASELATVQLGEGSVVRLAPSSRLRVLAGRERAVSLEGRAYFAVERMAGHALRVRTRAGEARVLGTRFELATDADRLELRVVEGRVALSTAHDRVEVKAGEEGGVRNGALVRPGRVAAAATVPTWVGTFLAFRETPLREAAVEIERVYHTPVTITDSTLVNETVTATFTDRPVQEVVSVVCSVLGARCETRDGRVSIGR